MELQLGIDFILLVIAIATVLLYLGMTIRNYVRDQELLDSVTSRNGGTQEERELVLSLIKSGIIPRAIFHDLMFEKRNGKYSQVDLIVALSVGIVVIEVKNYGGWIYGSGGNTNWTKVMAYGKKKYRFYNPIKQNSGHISSIRKQLKQFQSIPFYSVIVFYGDCELKEINYVPENTFLTKPHHISEVLNEIKNSNQVAKYQDKREVISLFKSAVEKGDDLSIQNAHIDQVADLIGKGRIFD